MPRYTEFPPEHRGELDLARQLEGMQDRRCHLWFGVGFLPGVRDIDILLLHEDAGLFVVEVKAVPLPAVIGFTFEACEINGRGRDKSPQWQAYDSATDLRNYLHSRVQLPFMTATACWPLITRRHWTEAFAEGTAGRTLADSMLFREDLTAGPATLRERLRHIYAKPPIRKEPWYPFAFQPRLLAQLRHELRPDAKPRPVESDLQRLRAIEGEVSDEAIRHAPPTANRKLIYTGYPGTGKTFRLLKIGHRHALEGRKVLLVCFNKVLATDLRRLMSFSTELSLASGSLEIRDAYELLVGLSSGLQITWPKDEDHDEWAAMVLEEVRLRERGGFYDTVLVDEGQDLRDWAFDMAEWLARDESTIAVAVGRGQELYGPEAAWLASFRQVAREHQLRRNFRNTKPGFRLAHTIYEAGFDPQKIERVSARFHRPSEEEQMEFLRDEGDVPELQYVDDAGFQALQPMDPAYAQLQHETMVGEYRRILSAELNQLSDNKWPMDVLVLVPSVGDPERTWALDAVHQLHGGAEYLDYTEDKLRRVPVRPTQIRLCTYHSARGIEGSTVILLGLEHIQRVSERAKTTLQQLAYIALSRSVARTVIVLPKSRARHQAAVAIELILRSIQVARPQGSTNPPDHSQSTLAVSPTVNSTAVAVDSAPVAIAPERQWISLTKQTLNVGTSVRHPTWGIGSLVMQLRNSDGSMRLIVDFEDSTRSLAIPPEAVEFRG